MRMKQLYNHEGDFAIRLSWCGNISEPLAPFSLYERGLGARGGPLVLLGRIKKNGGVLLRVSLSVATSMSAARAARVFIETAIKDHNVVVFSKTTCSFSILAKRILSEVGVQEMQVYEIERREDGREIQVRINR